MNYSTETVIFSNLLGYGAMGLGILAIWLKTKKVQEPYLLLKVIGYTFLAMFRFSFNQIHLPVGLIIAYILMNRSSYNKLIKVRAVFLGLILFIAGFIPIQNYIEEMIYPRDDIKTYLHKEIQEGIGFNLGVSRNGTPFIFLTEKDDMGVKLYESLYASKQNEERAIKYSEPQYEIYITQDHGDDRFRRLRIETLEGKHLVLHFEGQEYDLRSSPEFERLFAEIIK